MVGVGVAERVLVADLSKMIIARVGVAALAVVELVANRVVVVALDADDVVIAQEFEAAIRTRAKAAEVAEAIHGVNTPLTRIVDGSGQGEVIAINAAEAGDAVGGSHEGYCTRIGGPVSVGLLTFRIASTSIALHRTVGDIAPVAITYGMNNLRCETDPRHFPFVNRPFAV